MVKEEGVEYPDEDLGEGMFVTPEGNVNKE